MFKYVELDKRDKVVGISFLSGKLESTDMLLVDESIEVDIFYRYNPTTKKFTKP